MDKLIKKIQKDEKKTLKDTGRLLKLDKKQDAKLEKCAAKIRNKKKAAKSSCNYCYDME